MSIVPIATPDPDDVDDAEIFIAILIIWFCWIFKPICPCGRREVTPSPSTRWLARCFQLMQSNPGANSLEIEQAV